MEGSNLAIINNNTIRKKDTSNNKQVSEIFKRHIETKLKLRKIKNQEYLMVLKKAKLKSDNYNDNETNITKLDLSKHFESYLKDTSNSDITSNLVNHNFNEESCIRCLTEIRNYSIYKKNTNSNILELCNQFIETPLYLFFLVQSLIDKNDSIRTEASWILINILTEQSNDINSKIYNLLFNSNNIINTVSIMKNVLYNENNKEVLLNFIWLISHLALDKSFIFILENNIPLFFERMLEIYESDVEYEDQIYYCLYHISSLTSFLNNNYLNKGIYLFYDHLKSKLNSSVSYISNIKNNSNSCNHNNFSNYNNYSSNVYFEELKKTLFCVLNLLKQIGEAMSVNFCLNMYFNLAQFKSLSLLIEMIIDNLEEESLNKSISKDQLSYIYEFNMKIIIISTQCIKYLTDSSVIDLQVLINNGILETIKKKLSFIIIFIQKNPSSSKFLVLKLLIEEIKISETLILSCLLDNIEIHDCIISYILSLFLEYTKLESKFSIEEDNMLFREVRDNCLSLIMTNIVSDKTKSFLLYLLLKVDFSFESVFIFAFEHFSNDNRSLNTSLSAFLKFLNIETTFSDFDFSSILYLFDNYSDENALKNSVVNKFNQIFFDIYNNQIIKAKLEYLGSKKTFCIKRKEEKGGINLISRILEIMDDVYESMMEELEYNKINNKDFQYNN